MAATEGEMRPLQNFPLGLHEGGRVESTQPSSNILSEKGWIDKAPVMVPAKRDNYLQPPDREQQ